MKVRHAAGHSRAPGSVLRHDLTGALEQGHRDPERFVRDAEPVAVFEEFAGFGVPFERLEPKPSAVSGMHPAIMARESPARDEPGVSRAVLEERRRIIYRILYQ